MKKLIAIFVTLLASSALSVHADSSMPSNGVYDPDDLLSPATEQMVADFNEKSSKTEQKTQLGVYVVNDLNEQSFKGGNKNTRTYGDIEEIANLVAREWKIGYGDTNNGALLMVEIDDHQIRLETSNNVASYYITDAEAGEIVDDPMMQQHMRHEDYDAGISLMIQKIIKKLKPKNAEQIAEIKAQREKEAEEMSKMIIYSLGTGAGLITIGASIAGYRNYKHKKKLKERSNWSYTGPDKLYPNEDDFIDNPSWTPQRIDDYNAEQRRLQYERQLERSQYDYYGVNKLYPDDIYFIENASWTPELTNAYLQEKQRQEEQIRQDRLKRSQHDYKGNDKLYPDDLDFIENATWTTILINEYLESQSSSSSSYDSSSYDSGWSSSDDSSWSSSDWGGGGFDGGGASGGW